MNLSEYQTLINGYLNTCISCEIPQAKGLAEAMNYSLLAGGKRIRPILLLEFARICGGNVVDLLPLASAVEMIHTYSLIHDDLPCMDDDSLRRGKPTNHIVFGECTATLAGDALQPYAFSQIMNSRIDADAKVRCARILADSAGLNGMCGGQYLDIEGEGRTLSEDELTLINRNKTGVMISAACMMGVAAVCNDEDRIEAARRFGEYLGLAFQIRDDVLDSISSTEVLGKNIGSDADENKNTYMVLLGQEECERRIIDLSEKAINVLDATFSETVFLKSLTSSLVERMN